MNRYRVILRHRRDGEFLFIVLKAPCKRDAEREAGDKAGTSYEVSRSYLF